MAENGDLSSKVTTTEYFGGGVKGTGVERLDKKQVEQRIEEDRERHKRLRENIWAVDHDDRRVITTNDDEAVAGTLPVGYEIDPEFERLWDETSDMGSDDWALMEEEAAERKAIADALREEQEEE